MAEGHVLDILSKEIGELDRYRLIEDMVKTRIVMSEDFKYIHNLLNDLRKGILDRQD